MVPMMIKAWLHAVVSMVFVASEMLNTFCVARKFIPIKMAPVTIIAIRSLMKNSGELDLIRSKNSVINVFINVGFGVLVYTANIQWALAVYVHVLLMLRLRSA